MIALDKPKIIFFDMGNVFISDDPSGCSIYRQLFETIGAGDPVEFFARREKHLASGGFLWSFVRSCLPEEHFDGFRKHAHGHIFSDWQAYSPAIPGMAEAARRLKDHYRLGIIANQPDAAHELLRARGLRDLFEVCAISQTLGVSKPDLGIFRWALEQAQVEPHEAMMIGDRIDNDIRPAKSLGMRTLWLRLDFESRGWRPADAFEACYCQSAEKANVSEREPQTPEEEPDLVAHSPEELATLLLSLAQAPATRAL